MISLAWLEGEIKDGEAADVVVVEMPLRIPFGERRLEQKEPALHHRQLLGDVEPVAGDEDELGRYQYPTACAP